MKNISFLKRKHGIRICALPFAAFFAASASASTASWTVAMDAAWSTASDWIPNVVQADSRMSVFDASSMMNLIIINGADTSNQGVQFPMQQGLITIGRVDALTLGTGSLTLSTVQQDLRFCALVALAAEQSRNTDNGETLTAKGLIYGAEVNLNKIGVGELTLSGANLSLTKTTHGDEALNVQGSLNGTTGVKLIQPDFAALSIGAVSRQSPKLDAVRFNDGSGVVQSGPRGGKRTMKITVRGADKTGANTAAANAGGTTEDFRATLELPRGTGPLLAQNGAKELPLLNTETGNTDASNLTLNTANIVSLIHYNVGRQFTTVRLLPLLSPPAAQGTYGINFHGAYRAANADVTGTLGPGPANQANWVNTSSGVDVNSGPGNWSWTANDSNGGNPITFHFVHGNAGGEDGGGGGATDFARLFSTGERSNDGVFTITSTTSIPFSLYDIYIYGGGGYTVNTSGVTTSFAAVDGFVSGANTWLYSGRSGPLTINGGSINGFSIVPIPPPTAYWKGTTSAGWNGTPSNFTSDIAGTIPITLQSSNPANVIFNANGATNFANTTLGADITIRTLTFSNNATPSVVIGGSNTLTIKPDTSSTGILVESLSGDPTISTKVALGANQTWTITDGTQTLAVSGLISGAFSLTKAGVGTLILSGASTYTGATIINSGMLSINSIQNAGSATPNALGNPAVGPNSAISLAAAGTLRFTGSSNGSSDRAINLSTATGGTFTLDASGITTFALSGGVTSSGTSNVSTLTLTGAGNGTESGQIVNGTAPNITSVVKNGGGTWILGNTNNTYSGTTTVNEGKLQISGFITSNTTVNAASLAVSGTLAGTVTANGISTITLSGTITGTTTVNNGSILVGDNGTLGNVVINSGGTFSPGSGAIGSLTVNGSLNLNTSSILSIQFDSTAPATDQIFGGVNLNIATGATLNISDIGSNPELAYNIPASIITYSGSWNGGTFAGLPDDTYFTSGGRNFLISYNGADSDVPEGVLTLTMVQNVPEPGAAVSLLGGLGILLGVRRRRV